LCAPRFIPTLLLTSTFDNILLDLLIEFDNTAATKESVLFSSFSPVVGATEDFLFVGVVTDAFLFVGVVTDAFLFVGAGAVTDALRLLTA
jgi:hypothetical protein